MKGDREIWVRIKKRLISDSAQCALWNFLKAFKWVLKAC